MSQELSVQQLEAVIDGFQSLDMDGTSATNLFVANLPDNATDDSLKNMFSTFGSIISCKVMIDFNTGKSRGFGFVKFDTSPQAQQAIQVMNGVSYEGKTLTVKPANSNEPNQTPTNNIYIKGLPISFSKQNLEAMFSQFGKILESRILTDANTGFSRGIGFVRFETVDQATTAIRELNDEMLSGTSRPIIVKYADTEDEKLARRARLQTKRNARRGMGPGYAGVPQMAAVPGSYFNAAAAAAYQALQPALMPTAAMAAMAPGMSDASTLYVSNLPADTDDAGLYQLFAAHGSIQSAKVIRDRISNASRGFGFVRFLSYQEAWNALQSLNGAAIGGKVLSVAFKSPTRAQPQSAGPAAAAAAAAAAAVATRGPAMAPGARMPHGVVSVGGMQALAMPAAAAAYAAQGLQGMQAMSGAGGAAAAGPYAQLPPQYYAAGYMPRTAYQM